MITIPAFNHSVVVSLRILGRDHTKVRNETFKLIVFRSESKLKPFIKTHCFAKDSMPRSAIKPESLILGHGGKDSMPRLAIKPESLNLGHGGKPF